MNSTIALFSSARQNGNTDKLLQQINTQWPMEVIDLESLTISTYNYENKYQTDDFYALIDKILQCENIVFVSPVYWSAVIPLMKNFIDRLCELLDEPNLKHKAKQLKAKQAFVITTSASLEVSSTFANFFKELFRYFGMKFSGLLHIYCREGYDGENNDAQINEFLAKISDERNSFSKGSRKNV